MSELFLEFCKGCNKKTQFRYLDCDECKEKDKACIYVCVECGANE